MTYTGFCFGSNINYRTDRPVGQHFVGGSTSTGDYGYDSITTGPKYDINNNRYGWGTKNTTVSVSTVDNYPMGQSPLRDPRIAGYAPTSSTQQYFRIGLSPGKYRIKIVSGGHPTTPGNASWNLYIGDGAVGTPVTNTIAYTKNNTGGTVGPTLTATEAWTEVAETFVEVTVTGSAGISIRQAGVGMMLRWVGYEVVADPLEPVTLTDEAGVPLTKLYTLDPLDYEVAIISATTGAPSYTLGGTLKDYYFVELRENKYFIVTKDARIPDSMTSGTPTLWVIQTDATRVPSSPKCTNVIGNGAPPPVAGQPAPAPGTVTLTSSGGRPTDLSWKGQIPTKSWVGYHAIEQLVLTETAGIEWDDAVDIADPLDIFEAGNKAQLDTAMNAVATRPTKKCKILLTGNDATGFPSGVRLGYNVVMTGTGKLLIEPKPGHDPEINARFEPGNSRGWHLRGLRFGGYPGGLTNHINSDKYDAVSTDTSLRIAVTDCRFGRAFSYTAYDRNSYWTHDAAKNDGSGSYNWGNAMSVGGAHAVVFRRNHLKGLAVGFSTGMSRATHFDSNIFEDIYGDCFDMLPFGRPGPYQPHVDPHMYVLNTNNHLGSELDPDPRMITAKLTHGDYEQILDVFAFMRLWAPKTLMGNNPSTSATEKETIPRIVMPGRRLYEYDSGWVISGSEPGAEGGRLGDTPPTSLSTVEGSIVDGDMTCHYKGVVPVRNVYEAISGNVIVGAGTLGSYDTVNGEPVITTVARQFHMDGQSPDNYGSFSHLYGFNNIYANAGARFLTQGGGDLHAGFNTTAPPASWPDGTGFRPQGGEHGLQNSSAITGATYSYKNILGNASGKPSISGPFTHSHKDMICSTTTSNTSYLIPDVLTGPFEPKTDGTFHWTTPIGPFDHLNRTYNEIESPISKVLRPKDGSDRGARVFESYTATLKAQGSDAASSNPLTVTVNVKKADPLAAVPPAGPITIMLLGSSTPEKYFDVGTGPANAGVSVSVDGINWAPLGTAGAGATVLGDVIQKATGRPVRLIDVAVSSTKLSDYEATPSTFRNTAVTAALAAGGVDIVISIVGFNDASANTLVSTAAHEAMLDSFLSKLRSELGKPNLPIAIGGSQNRYVTPIFETKFAMLHDAEARCWAKPNNHFYAHAYDLPQETDGIHQTPASMAIHATRGAHNVLGALQLGGTVQHGPSAVGVGIIDNTNTRVFLAHEGGTDFTPFTPSAITGFTISFDNFATSQTPTAVRETATTVRLTHTDSAGAQPYVRVLYGQQPVVTASVHDNGPDALPLNMLGVALAQPGDIADLVATSMNSSTVQLKWTASARSTGHKYRVNGVDKGPCSGPPFLVTGLDPSTPYNFEVQGVNGTMVSNWTTIASATTDITRAYDQTIQLGFGNSTNLVTGWNKTASVIAETIPPPATPQTYLKDINGVEQAGVLVNMTNAAQVNITGAITSYVPEVPSLINQSYLQDGAGTFAYTIQGLTPGRTYDLLILPRTNLTGMCKLTVNSVLQTPEINGLNNNTQRWFLHGIAPDAGGNILVSHARGVSGTQTGICALIIYRNA